MSGVPVSRWHSHRGRWVAAVAVGITALASPLAVVGARASSDPACSSWPMYQHDPLHTGDAGACTGETAVSPGNVTSLVPRWFVPTSGSVTATPTVANGTAYVGDGSGTLYGVSVAPSAPGQASYWSLVLAPGPGNPGGVTDDNTGHTDEHSTSYAQITSSAAYGQVPGLAHPTVFVGAGGSVFAIDPVTHQKVWATDVDPGKATSPEEVESSPVLYTPDGSSQTELLVGDDVNESDGTDRTGLLALNAATGQLLWKFEPETGVVTTVLSDPGGHGCGDVWSSPAVDAKNNLVFFGTGNCNDTNPADIPESYARSEALWALDASTGSLRWAVNPPDAYNQDDDLGASPNLAELDVPGKKRPEPIVVVASKAGVVSAYDRITGSAVWKSSTQAAQPGQLGSGPGAIGGFIGSGALGTAGTKQAWFGASAPPAPFAGGGVPSGPDTTLSNDPERVASLHAVALADGTVLWHQPIETPTYAPVTYSDGVVFAPSTTSFAAEAYDAASGTPLWGAPAAAALSSGVSVVGSDVFFGAGTYESPSAPVPPQNTGIWSFGLPGS